MLGRSLSHPPPPKVVLPCLITDDPPIISAKGSLLLPAVELTAPPLKFRPESGGLDETAPNIFEKSSFFGCEEVCPPSKLLRKSKTSLFVGLLSDYFVIGFSSKSSFSNPDAND
jgi:hypothetical protein